MSFLETDHLPRGIIQRFPLTFINLKRVFAMNIRIVSLLSLLAIWASGCTGGSPSPSERPARSVPETSLSSSDLQGTVAHQIGPENWDWENVGDLLSSKEYWDVCYLGGSKVGYEHTVVEQRMRNAVPLVRVVQEQVINLRRFSEGVALRVEFESWQTPEGYLLAFRGRQEQGIAPMEFAGYFRGDHLLVEQLSAGRKETQKIPRKEPVKGFRAVEESLVAEPMQPGDYREVEFLLPVFHIVAKAELRAKDFEPVRLLSGTYELLRIDMRTVAGEGFELTGTLWTDRSGEVLKSFTEAMKLEVYRATREEALAEAPPVVFDLGQDVRVPVVGELPRPHETKRVRYRVLWDGGDAARLFTVGPTQQVEAKEDGSAEIIVYAIRPREMPPHLAQMPEDPPSEGDLEPNAYIQSDNPPIVKLAEEITKGLEDPWEIAIALERGVHAWITDSNYKVGFASAAEVLESRQGDCTEHAVLLAALARAKKIPSRVVMGLVYNNGAFYYHMWTEVYIDGLWYPLDGTLARGGIGAAHLKMATSNLKGSAALAGILPILQALGRLKIEILEREY